ncbi:dopamine D2-like receptor [Actinia tenebrosa]|uniref:Dopamine D2-like receptor n=1 Tax=Actinia tenebrosa TaxID=6105 RepID=A0A6P8IYT9_ACTTE|nr:dopamine D2-like receptor [Actinia tenebrosa]XP_031572335.1 dopamine D2-like receptor [Actinia tenebrosa]XP_031572337.1 dopamine D2-like receptor [Actinia tenebrosa]XP_031572338.1 dopamine D2-like receptor [Actinia tenebrosa]XP_031572339.1 dopamine D2-like receptor [Actinia tenebrosa]XP_031572340.1 dopamine D2-like receptor [Actinia tenebrosa]XP_031572341.1 dopamine D2-like receptor [Actinia tenebrosa]XP_031572342.1 dopamine D2-like receptor [Actinia tenebrosa]
MNNSSSQAQPGGMMFPEPVGWCVSFGVLAACIIAGNLIAISVLTRKRFLRRRTSYFLLSLTVADLMVGTISVPTYIFQLAASPSSDNTFVKYIKASDVFCSLASTFTLTIIALERVFAITYPLQHRVSTKKLYYILVSSVWILAGVLSSLYFFYNYKLLDHDVFFYFMLITFALSLFIMLVAYIVIWIRVTKTLYLDEHKHHGSLSATDSFSEEKKSKDRIELTPNPSNGKSRSSPVSLRKFKGNKLQTKALTGKDVERSRSRADSEKKLALTLFIVTAVFIVTWLPFQIINIIVFRCRKYKLFCIPPIDVIYFCKLLNYSNSFINPVVYSLRLPDFRLALKKIVFKKLRCLLCLD